MPTQKTPKRAKRFEPDSDLGAIVEGKLSFMDVERITGLKIIHVDKRNREYVATLENWVHWHLDV